MNGYFTKGRVKVPDSRRMKPEIRCKIICPTKTLPVSFPNRTYDHRP